MLTYIYDLFSQIIKMKDFNLKIMKLKILKSRNLYFSSFFQTLITLM